MKKIILISAVIISTGAFSVQAQEVTKDSISILKKQKDDLEISKRLNDNKLKLAELQNTVQQKTADSSSSAKDAQQAAADNQETAEKLNNDSQDKKLAKKARKDAKHAQSAAKAGRNASGDLADLQKEIASLQKKIKEDEARLGIANTPIIQ